jgi:hypothetical protein
MERTETQASTGNARSVTVARWWHGVTFVAGAFGVIGQLWIVATQTPTAVMAHFSDPIRLWNVLSFFTIWSNILVAVVAVVAVVAYLLARTLDGAVLRLTRSALPVC